MRRRAFLFATLFASLLAIPTVAAAVPAVEVPAEPGLAVLLEEISPAVPTPDKELVVRGRVRNSSALPVEDVSVVLRGSRNPLGNRSELVARTAPGRGIQDLPALAVTAELGTIDAGAAVAFTLQTPLAELGLSRFGVYPFGVEARAAGVPLAAVPTFLPWVPEGSEVAPTQVTWLWPVAAEPTRVALDPATGAVDKLPDALGPDGRLTKLVRAGQVAGPAGDALTWVLDPMLLDELATLQTRQGTGEAAVTPGSPSVGSPAGADTAESWLTTLRDATRGKPRQLLPYGNPDFVALSRHSQLGALVRSRELAAAVGQRLDLTGPALLWPPGGVITNSTLDVLTAQDQPPLVLREPALPLEAAVPYTPSGRAQLTTLSDRTVEAVVADESLSTLVARNPAPDDELRTAAFLRQLFLAETAMVTAERPNDSRSLIIAPQQLWNPDPALAAELLSLTAATPWMRPLSLPAALALPADQARGPLVYPEDARERELPGSYLRAVADWEAEVLEFGEILTEPELLLDPYLSYGIKLRSGHLRPPAEPLTGEDPPPARLSVTREELLEAGRRSLVSQRNSVRIVSSGVTLGAKDGPIPVTVVNGLDQAVRVQVRLSPDLPRILVNEEPQLTVEAGRRAQVNVPAQSVANGTVQVKAQLLTPDGSEYAPPVAFDVRVTRLDTVGLVLTSGAAVLLVLAAAYRTVRRVRARPRSSPAAAATAGTGTSTE